MKFIFTDSLGQEHSCLVDNSPSTKRVAEKFIANKGKCHGLGVEVIPCIDCPLSGRSTCLVSKEWECLSVKSFRVESTELKKEENMIRKDMLRKRLMNEKGMTFAYAGVTMRNWINRGLEATDIDGHDFFDPQEVNKFFKNYKPKKRRTKAQPVINGLIKKPDTFTEKPRLKDITNEYIDAVAKKKNLTRTQVIANILDKHVFDKIMEVA